MPCTPCPRPCASRLSYRGPNGRVVGAGCAPARPYRKRSCRVAALSARVPRPSAQRPRALRLPARPAAQPQYNIFYCSQFPAKLSPSVTIQIFYRDTAFPANSLQYNICIATHIHQSLKYNILSVLQYTITSFTTSKSQYNHPLAIQFSLSQYDLGGSPSKFSAQQFFFSL